MWRVSSPYQVLAILTLINFLNYVDRMVLSGILPKLQDPVAAGGLGLTSSQAGLLQAAFMVVHSVASIPLGIAADRFLRRRLIALGVGLWSIATALAGFARSYGQLFVSRAAVGIGEASYAPAATALISEYFPAASRGRAMGVFQAGTVLGGGVGIVVGGLVAGQWGWRAAFFVVGLPGLLLVLAALAIAERSPAERAAAEGPREKKPLLLEMKQLVRTRGIFWVYAAGILVTFTIGAFTYWGPTFVVREFYGGDSNRIDEVARTFGPIVILSAVAGVWVGSVLGDRLERRMPGRGRLMIVALGPLIGAPFVGLGVWTPSEPLMYACLALGTALNSFYAGPVLAALHDIVGDAAHATATGAYFFLVHVLGDAISPWVVGRIDDATGSLRTALFVAAAAAAIGGFAALVGVRRIAAATSVPAAGGSAG